MVLDLGDIILHLLVLGGNGIPDVLESVEGFIGTGHEVIMLEDELIRRFNQSLRRVLTFLLRHSRLVWEMLLVSAF